MALAAVPTHAFAAPSAWGPTTTMATVYLNGRDSGPYCVPHQDPDQGINGGYCTCNDGGKYYFATGSNICPYTSKPPASETVQDMSAVTGSPQVCKDGTKVDPSCWRQLGLTDYVNDWWKKHESECEDKYDGFADCWYALNTPYSPTTCDKLHASSGCSKPNWVDFEKKKDGAKIFFITYALFNTNDFFKSIYDEIGRSAGYMSNTVGYITDVLNPPDPDPNKGWDYLFYAATFALSWYAEGTIIMKAMLRSAPQSSTLFSKVFFKPEDPISETVHTWAAVSNQLAGFTQDWSKSVDEGLPYLINNVTIWTQFANEGLLTGENPDIGDLGAEISRAFGTYVVSHVIQELGLVVGRADNVDVHGLQTGDKKLMWDTGCGDGYDHNGICGDVYYYDGRDTYSLVDPKTMTRGYKDVFDTLFTSHNNVTTPKALFSDGYKCTKSCGKNGDCDPKLNDKDASQAPSCLSSIRVCTWAWDKIGPFTDCKNLPDKDAVLPRFGVDGCVGSQDYITGSTDKSVPKDYLGGGILDTSDAEGDWKSTVACNSGYE